MLCCEYFIENPSPNRTRQRIESESQRIATVIKRQMFPEASPLSLDYAKIVVQYLPPWNHDRGITADLQCFSASGKLNLRLSFIGMDFEALKYTFNTIPTAIKL